MITLRWKPLLAVVLLCVPLIYLVVKEELRQAREMTTDDELYSSQEFEDALIHGERTRREANKSTYNIILQRPSRGRHTKRVHQLIARESALQLKIDELYAKLQKCTRFTNTEEATIEDVRQDRPHEDIPTVFVVTPTFKRFVQKAELTQVSQALNGVKNLHWIIVEDSSHQTELVRNFAERSSLRITLLHVSTPDLLRRHKGEFRRFKPRGVYQRNLAIQWIRDNVDYTKNPGVVYFADDDNTYDSKLFDEMRWIKGVGIWPVGFTGGARWAGPICRGGRVVGFHTKWGSFRPFPIDMAGFAINIKKLIKEFPEAGFKAMKKPGMLESSLLSQITSREELEPRADECTKVLVWHTRTEKPLDNMRGERQLIRQGHPSNPDIET